MKRLLAILLTAVMIITGIPVPKTQVMAAGNGIREEVTYDAE